MKKIIVVLFLLSFSCFAKDLYHNNNLIYFWDFEDERRFLIDVKSNTIGHKRGTVRWIPREYSYHNSPVIHIHGNVDPNSSFTIPARYLERQLNEWTLDFEFGAGSHNLDHTNRDNGELMPFGQILRWGDLRITFFQDSGQKWRGIVRIIYQGQTRTIEYLRGFKYYYMAIRSEDDGISIWLDSYCTDYIEIPRTSVVGLPIVFGGNGFAGRFDDIKVYNKRLKPWEITSNYWGKELELKRKGKQLLQWSEIKSKRL